MHLLLHQYLQKPAEGLELRELTEPLRLQWPASLYTDVVEVYLPDAGPGEEPVAETFARLQASPVNSSSDVPRQKNSAAEKNDEPLSARPDPRTEQLAVTVTQAERPGLYRIRRFRPEGAVNDISIALNVPSTESALSLADERLITQSTQLSHVRILNADAAAALAGRVHGAARRLLDVLLAVYG